MVALGSSPNHSNWVVIKQTVIRNQPVDTTQILVGHHGSVLPVGPQDIAGCYLAATRHMLLGQ